MSNCVITINRMFGSNGRIIGKALAGGLGNLIDRLLRGEVVDFIDVRIINFAVFNVADICAVLGAIGLLLFVVIDEIKEQKK